MRVIASAVDGEHPLQWEDDVIRIADLEVYTILVRVRALSVWTDAEQVGLADPVNIELITGATLFDEPVGGTRIDRARLEVDASGPGSGVLGGERVSMFVGGLYEGLSVEYRAERFDPVEIEAGIDLGPGRTLVELRFDVEGWFEDIDFEALEATGRTVRLDSEHNAAAAAAVDAAVRDGVRLHVGGCEGACEPSDDQDPEGGSQ